VPTALLVGTYAPIALAWAVLAICNLEWDVLLYVRTQRRVCLYGDWSKTSFVSRYEMLPVFSLTWCSAALFALSPALTRLALLYAKTQEILLLWLILSCTGNMSYHLATSLYLLLKMALQSPPKACQSNEASRFSRDNSGLFSQFCHCFTKKL